MFGSFSAALSALNAHSTAVDVTGNNLANLNTQGFKASSVAFFDLVTQSVGAGLGESQVGFGVAKPITLRQFTQGAVQSSSGDLDAAIQGDGFFVVNDSNGAQLLTRSGRMQVDKQGYLMTATGQRVQGWTQVNGTVNTNAGINDILVPVGTVKAPVVTNNFSIQANLDATAQTGDVYSTPMTVYDSLGVSHVLTVTFTKNATAGQWDVSATIPGAEVTGGTPGTPFALTPTPAAVTFGANGQLPAFTAPGTISLASIPLNNGSNPLNLNWNLYDPNNSPLLTQYSQKSAVSSSSQDGSGAAQLIRVGIANGGKVLAQYSNGTQVVVGQIAMASVRNADSLISVGSNNYQLSARSANPAIGIPLTGGRGDIVGGAIESSTTDIAKEFTNLIVYQRGYQANSRVITTVDELSQETINLKR